MIYRTLSQETNEKTLLKEMAPLTGTYDPGNDHQDVENCLNEHSHLLSSMRIVLGWRERDNEPAVRHKISVAKQHKILTVTDIHSPKWVITRGMLPVYLDRCSEIGLDAVRVRNDTISHEVKPREAVRLADQHDLDVYFQIEDFGLTPLTERSANAFINTATRWFDAGAVHLVVNAGEFGNVSQRLRMKNAELFANAFGMHTVMFVATSRQQQEAFLSFFGEEVHLCDVPLQDVAQLEKLRSSGLYSAHVVSTGSRELEVT